MLSVNVTHKTDTFHQRATCTCFARGSFCTLLVKTMTFRVSRRHLRTPQSPPRGPRRSAWPWRLTKLLAKQSSEDTPPVATAPRTTKKSNKKVITIATTYLPSSNRIPTSGQVAYELRDSRNRHRHRATTSEYPETRHTSCAKLQWSFFLVLTKGHQGWDKSVRTPVSQSISFCVLHFPLISMEQRSLCAL